MSRRAAVPKEYRPLVAAARDQGWRVEQGGRAGCALKLYPPDPTKPLVTLHRTPSDHRGLANTLALMRRAGLRM